MKESMVTSMGTKYLLCTLQFFKNCAFTALRLIAGFSQQRLTWIVKIRVGSRVGSWLLLSTYRDLRASARLVSLSSFAVPTLKPPIFYFSSQFFRLRHCLLADAVVPRYWYINYVELLLPEVSVLANFCSGQPCGRLQAERKRYCPRSLSFKNPGEELGSYLQTWINECGQRDRDYNWLPFGLMICLFAGSVCVWGWL